MTTWEPLSAITPLNDHQLKRGVQCGLKVVSERALAISPLGPPAQLLGCTNSNFETALYYSLRYLQTVGSTDMKLKSSFIKPFPLSLKSSFRAKVSVSVWAFHPTWTFLLNQNLTEYFTVTYVFTTSKGLLLRSTTAYMLHWRLFPPIASVSLKFASMAKVTEKHSWIEPLGGFTAGRKKRGSQSNAEAHDRVREAL